AAEKQPFYRNCLQLRGLIDYRLARFAAAQEWLKRVAPKEDGEAVDARVFAVLAMTHHRLGRAEEARAALACARAILTRKMANPEQGKPFNNDWPHWLSCRLLYREAEALLNGDGRDQPASQEKETPPEKKPNR